VSTLLQQNTIPISLVEGANPAVGSSANGTVIRLVTTDENIAHVVQAGFTRLAVERSTNGGLSYAEITVPSERVVLDPNQPVMEAFDRNGDPSYYYRFRYVGEIAGKCVESQPSEAIEGIGLAIRSVLTVEQMKKRYFFGINFGDGKGNTLPDAVWEHYILGAIRWFEHQLDIPILPTHFLERHDYYRQDYEAFAFIKLDNCPVLKVNEFRVQYPSGQNVIVFPNEWLRLNNFEGQIQIVPTAGTLSEILVGAGGSFLPAAYNGLMYLPQLFEIDYEAGFEHGRVPRNLVDVIGMFASLGPLHMFGDLLGGAGIASYSLSMDGLSQSINTTSSPENAGFGARVKQYLQQIKQQIPLLRAYYHGQRMVVA
jgi:hypothetical protein